MNCESKPNPLVELHEYKIISRFYAANDEHEDEDDDESKSIEIFLPTPESLEKLCDSKLIKEVVNFDLTKFVSFFAENPEKEKIILNLDKIKSLSNKDLLPFILVFIGGINSINTIYDIFEGIETELQPKENIYIDHSENYLNYILSILDFFKGKEKFSIPFSQMKSLFTILDEIGINIHRDDKNILYRSIKDSFFLMERNKILIIVAPSNNFWIKSEKSTRGDQNYDIRLNNYSYIFYNKKFIQKFLSKIAKHPRCCFGLISSMTYKNLKNCWEALEKQFSNICPKKIIFIDQKDHDQVMQDPNKKKMSFFRNMQKIIEHLKREKEKELKIAYKNYLKGEDNNEYKGDDNIGYFDNENIIILESEEDKIGEDTKWNFLKMNVFNEQYLEFNEKQKLAIDLQGDKVIDYVFDLLENCTDDIREYLHNQKN